MLAEEFNIIDSDSPLWVSISPLLDIALRFDQYDEGCSWKGWNKRQINNFLDSLPLRSSLVVGVWETIPEKEGSPECEKLVVGLVFEINGGEVSSIRIFDALTIGGLKPSNQLEPGNDDAREIIRHSEKLVAPVAWALFMEKSTWDEWLFGCDAEDTMVVKGQQITIFAR